MKKINILIVVLLLLLITGCKKTNDSGKIKIVTTIFPQYSFTKEIVKDLCDVELIMTPGKDSHNFDPSAQVIISINKADIFIYTSLHMEKWATKVLSNIKKDGPVIVEAAKNITFDAIVEEQHDDHGEEEHGDHDHDHTVDPHVWTSLNNSIQMVKVISSAICAYDPDNELKYRANSDDLINRLKKLDTEYKEFIQTLNSKTMYFVTPVPFYYLAKDYDLKYESLYATCSTEVEPTTETILKMINLIKQNNVKYIFQKEMTTSKIPQTIAKQTTTEILTLHSAHAVSKDDYNNNVSYYDIMKNNLEILKVGLK